jgi:hypothetical protein
MIRFQTEMKPTDFDWKTGVITFWELDALVANRPFPEQAELLKEDLVQVEFPKEIVLDIGWYPSFDPDGWFVILVVRRGNWDEPFYRATTTDRRELENLIREATLLAAQS